jgi:DNA-binding transcriptional MerR regulator
MELRQTMADEHHEVIFWRTEHSRLNLHDLADAAGVHPELVEQFIEYGLLEPMASEAPDPLFAISAIERLRRIMRLRRDLGVNLPGVAVILDMRERMEQLQKELERLRRRSGREE